RSVSSVDDIKGMTIRSAGGTIDMIVEALGAIPTPITSGDIFQALERGTVDGNIQGLAGAVGNSVHEVVDSVTINGNFAAFLSTWSMNEDRFADMPSEVQELLIVAGQKT